MSTLEYRVSWPTKRRRVLTNRQLRLIARSLERAIKARGWRAIEVGGMGACGVFAQVVVNDPRVSPAQIAAYLKRHTHRELWRKHFPTWPCLWTRDFIAVSHEPGAYPDEIDFVEGRYVQS